MNEFVRVVIVVAASAVAMFTTYNLTSTGKPSDESQKTSSTAHKRPMEEPQALDTRITDQVER